MWFVVLHRLLYTHTNMYIQSYAILTHFFQKQRTKSSFSQEWHLQPHKLYAVLKVTCESHFKMLSFQNLSITFLKFFQVFHLFHLFFQPSHSRQLILGLWVKAGQWIEASLGRALVWKMGTSLVSSPALYKTAKVNGVFCMHFAKEQTKTQTKSQNLKH